MSAQSSSTALPSAGHGDGNSGSDFPGDGPQPIEGAAAGEPALPLATAELANLLANGQWGDGAHGFGADAWTRMPTTATWPWRSIQARSPTSIPPSIC